MINKGLIHPLALTKKRDLWLVTRRLKVNHASPFHQEPPLPPPFIYHHRPSSWTPKNEAPDWLTDDWSFAGAIRCCGHSLNWIPALAPRWWDADELDATNRATESKKETRKRGRKKNGHGNILKRVGCPIKDALSAPRHHRARGGIHLVDHSRARG